jgi:tyrosyl-tRNA synthetase
LAKDITERVHGAEALETALKTTDFLFGNGSLDFLKSLNDEDVLSVFEGISQFNILKDDFAVGYDALTLLADKTSIFPSKGEAKKMIVGGGVSLNREKIGSPEKVFNVSDLINDKFLVVQKGKKNYFLVIVE